LWPGSFLPEYRQRFTTIGKHHAIGAVEDGIGDIGGFRPGWVNTPWRTKRLNDSLMIASALQTKNTFINMKNLHLILSY
jgi:hypothetical protein